MEEAPENETPRLLRPDDVLPSNVCGTEQLSRLPRECLSGNDRRPLLHVDDRGERYTYSLQPMGFSVGFILVVELLERFSFYGYYYTLTLFLTGAYNEDWNAGFASVKASSFVSTSTMVAYSTPFLGAFLADSLWGDYKAILFGLLVFYVPGILLMTLTTVPGLLGEEFNESLLVLSMLVLWPLGTGCLKSVINVFGAKQFHPLLQSSMIESYYVNFYMAINVGALAGIATIPLLAQKNVSIAYSWPLALLVAGVLVFVAGTPRYVRSPPRGEIFGTSRKRRTSSGVDRTIPLSTIFRICLLIVPFNVVYNQMPTTFIVQGHVMSKAFGVFDVASMNCLDALSVLVFGSVTASYIYPELARRGIKLATTHKFAIGSGLGALAICWALWVERMIHQAYEKDGSQISVLWQSPSYVLIGWGEIFAVSTAYEVAFTASSPDKKALASATNIFCVGGLPNLICILLYHSCSRWFRNDRGTTEIAHLEDYATARVANYFLVLLGIMIFGIALNLVPSITDYVGSVEEQAIELVKTPVPRKTIGHAHGDGGENESSPMLTPRSGRYHKYVDNANGPVLYKMGSMRAGPSMTKTNLPGAKAKKFQYQQVKSLYHNATTNQPAIPHGQDSNPTNEGQLIRYKKQTYSDVS